MVGEQKSVCTCVCVIPYKWGLTTPAHTKDHEPCATFRRCRCSCAIKQCRVQCSENVPMSTEKKENRKEKRNRKKSTKTAPWLRTPEPPITKIKERREKGKHHGPKEKTVPENVPKKTSYKVLIQTNPISSPIHAIRIPPNSRTKRKCQPHYPSTLGPVYSIL